MIKAVFFDIDGTLVSFHTHRVSEATRQAIRQLRTQGIKVFIATGRHLQVINNLGDLEFDGYVTLNGSCCYIGKTVNIYKFGRHFSRTHYVPFLEAYSKALGNNEYYEQVLRVIAMLDDPEIRAKRLSGQLWYEIDDIQDLDIASSMFAQDPDLRVSLMQGRYGGYWRYPQLLDFCYLVNPYFPPQRLIDEIQANFTSLLTQYPSGMRVNALLAARNFAVHQQNILVGNGAAELIKALMARLEGATGFIRPTFEEYPNR